MRPAAPEIKMGVVEWIDSLVPGAPVEVLWDDAFWPSKIVELVGRPTVEEAETMSVAAAAAEEKAGLTMGVRWPEFAECADRAAGGHSKRKVALTSEKHSKFQDFHGPLLV